MSQSTEWDDELDWFDGDPCNRCGGGIDRDHPSTCSACLYEQQTGSCYERDVDKAQALGLTLEEYAARRTRTLEPRP